MAEHAFIILARFLRCIWYLISIYMYVFVFVNLRLWCGVDDFSFLPSDSLRKWKNKHDFGFDLAVRLMIPVIFILYMTGSKICSGHSVSDFYEICIFLKYKDISHSSNRKILTLVSFILIFWNLSFAKLSSSSVPGQSNLKWDLALNLVITTPTRESGDTVTSGLLLFL